MSLRTRTVPSKTFASSLIGAEWARVESVAGGAFILLCVLVLGFAAAAQRDPDARPIEDYRDLWERGEYQRALEDVEAMIAASDNYEPIRLKRDYAELLFETGRVDEAIGEMEEVRDRYPYPAYSLELALMYKYRGRLENYERELHYAANQVQSGSWRSQRQDENLVAWARIDELRGENPKTILNSHYSFLIERLPALTIAYIGAGDLAYRNAGYDVAANYYTRALEQEPDDQDALAGLAECYWKSHDDRLEAILKSLLDINPNHPRARAILVEQFLDSGDAESALELIEKALVINPVSLRFLSLKSAALFLQDQESGMKTVLDQVLKFNPYCSEVYTTTGRIASRHYRFAEGAAFQEKALEIDPKDREARASYTLDLLRLGREEKGRDVLDAAVQADPYNVHLHNLSQLLDTLEGYATVERGPFVLRLPVSEKPVLADEALALLDEAIAEFTSEYDAELDTPVLVEIFDNHDDFMVRSIGLPGNVGHLGICFGKVVTMDSPSARPKGSYNWRSVLWHEFMHVITLQKTKNRMPRWLSEGISVFEEGRRSEAWTSRLDPQYRALLAAEGIPTVSDLDGYFTAPNSAGHLMFGYFVAGEFVKFYVEEYGFEALADSLEAIGAKTPADAALTTAAGVTADAMDEAFEAYLEKRFKPYENLPSLQKESRSALLEFLENFRRSDDEAPESPDAGGALRVGQSMRESPFTDAMKSAREAWEAEDWEKAEAELRKAHELFPDYTESDAPLRQLARLYEKQGRIDDLKSVLWRIIRWTPSEPDACRRQIELLESGGDWAGVAEVVEIALGVDPFDVPLRNKHARALRETGRAEEALAALSVLAHLDTLRAIEHRLERGELLAELGRWNSAKAEVVAVLEEVPYYWEAQSLLLNIVEEKAPGGTASEPREKENSSD